MDLEINNKTKKLFISNNASIKEALSLIQKNKERVCFSVSKKNKVLSSITDGDIRRGLLRGINLNDKITRVQNKNFDFLQEGFNYNEAYKKFTKKINILPIIDRFGKLKGYLRKQDVVPFLDIKSKTITVLGLGYVGLTLALVLSESGFEVRGCEKDIKILNQLKKKQPPFYEKGLQRYLIENINKNFTASNKIVKSDVYIITVGTPIKKNKTPDLSILKKSVLDISSLLKKGDLIILRSTVSIGSTRNLVSKLIEKKTNLKFGKDIFLAFCPERTIEGNAMDELKKLPQIVGGYCKKSSELAKRIFSEYNYTVIEVENLEAAELCKLIDNTYRDTIFAYSNQISKLTEKLNLNLVEIIDKVNLAYERNVIPKPSPGVGGPCLSKDPYIIHDNFKKKGITSQNLILHSRKLNEQMIKDIYLRVKNDLHKLKKNKSAKIFISGFAFKGNPETTDIRGSTTIELLKFLKKAKFTNIWGHDFKLNSSQIKKLGIKYASINNGFKNADAVLIMNNNNKYQDLKLPSLIKSTKKPLFFFDSWQIYSPLEIKNIKGVVYGSVGYNS